MLGIGHCRRSLLEPRLDDRTVAGRVCSLGAGNPNPLAFVHRYDPHDLTILIGLINLWNRLAIGFRYQHPVEQVR